MATERWRGLGATLRFRVTAVATLAVLGVLVIAGVGLAAAQRSLLTENLAESLAQTATAIETPARAGKIPAVLTALGDDDAVGQVVGLDGEVMAATANVVGRSPIVEPAVAADHPGLRTLDHLPVDGADYLVLSRPVEDRRGRPLVILVAATLSDVDESTRVLVTSLVVAIPVIVVVLGTLMWWLIGRTLRPVEAIRAEVAGIGATDLHRRVPEPPGGDEIARLARTMNGMLDRVEDAARRQSRFIADASHELRSPLTRMRSELEVDLAQPAGADPVATHRSVLEEAVGLQHLVDDLLHLARSDAGAPSPRCEAVDVDDIVLAHAQRLRAEGKVTVDTTGVGAAQVYGDRQHLGRAVGNLVDNAARHATSVVTVTVAEDGGTALVSVADDGPGIPPDAGERVFERFTRLDEARTGDTGGSGLGLPIARDIVVRHGGTLTVDLGHAGGARLVIALPVGATNGH